MTRNTLLRIAVVTIACAIAILSGCDAKERSLSAQRASKPAKPTSESKDAMTSKPNPEIVIETSMGTIRAELFADKAPKTVENFLQYVDDEYFDGLVFHRVIDGFMVQGGGLDADLKPKPAKAPIKNEASAKVPNKRGTLAMARTSEVNSATSQFFINLVDNDFLNHRDETPAGFGYCAFGQVTDGMDVVDKIAKVETTTMPPHQDVPAEPVVINSIRRAE